MTVYFLAVLTRVKELESASEQTTYKANVQISNRYRADILHDLIGHMVDQQQIPLAIFGEKGESSVKSLVFTASSVITVTQEYARTSSQKQSSIQCAKINPQVNHV